MERESNSSDKERVIQVGHRIEVLNETGFVRFIGSLETCETSALWVGIEWDNPTRGKHDGTYNGKKYFHCIRNKGSFIKLEQLEKIPRRSFVEALMDKYCFDNLEQISHASNKFFGNKEAQFVGFDKAADQFKRLSSLKHIALPNYCIYQAGNDLGTKSDALASVEVLDLSSNLFSEFSEILTVINFAPSLRELILSNNRFERIETTCTATNNQIHLLVMNDCFYDFESVLNSLVYFPNVEELHLSHNYCNYDFFRLSHICPYLKTVVLDMCGIESWEQLSPLGTLPLLKKLSLAGNNLSDIHFKTENNSKNDTRAFEHLEHINLSGNKLKGLTVINELAKLPSLKSLRIDDLSMNSGEIVPRFQFIGRLGQLLYLNGSLITENERRDAELAYIKFICEQTKSGSVEFSENVFPRLEALKNHYADYFSEQWAEWKSRLPTKQVVITLSSEMTKDESEGWTRKLPCSIPVRKLKQIAAKQFKLKQVDQLALYFHRKSSEEDSTIKFYLEDESCPLSYYGIESGTTIFVGERTAI